MKWKRHSTIFSIALLGVFVGFVAATVLSERNVRDGKIFLEPDEKYLNLIADEKLLLNFSRMAKNTMFFSIFRDGTEIVSVSVPTNPDEAASIMLFSKAGDEMLGEVVLEENKWRIIKAASAEN